jgi:hypothetical protein
MYPVLDGMRALDCRLRPDSAEAFERELLGKNWSAELFANDYLAGFIRVPVDWTVPAS